MTEHPPKSVEALAQFYRVNERTIKRWRSKAAPLHDVAEMAKWALTQKRLPMGFQVRMRELTGEAPLPNERKKTIEEWEKQKAARPKDKGGEGRTSSIEHTEEFLAYFKTELDAAI